METALLNVDHQYLITVTCWDHMFVIKVLTTGPLSVWLWFISGVKLDWY